MTYRDGFGTFEIEAEEEFDGMYFQWRKYTNSPVVKAQGGMYANYCVDTKQIKFYRNDFIRDRSFSKFIERCKNGSSKTVQTD